MNKKILITTLGLGVSLFVLSSYQDGPAHGGAGNRSGSNGSPSCAQAGCHGSENANFALTLSFTDVADNSVVSDGKYTPGHTYIASLVGNYPGNTTYTHLGFQASVVNAANANTGTLATNIANTGTSTSNTGGINVIEHTSPIPKTGSQFVASFKWTAPAAGNGDAKVYARMLANNHNGTAGDDTPNSIVATLTEKVAPTGINQTAQTNLFKIYPNPAQNSLNVKLDQLISGKYDMSIVGIDGKVVMSSKTNFSGGEMKIDLSKFAKGIYVLTIRSQNSYQVARFVKQ